jgi:hypothetical protein
MVLFVHGTAPAQQRGEDVEEKLEKVVEALAEMAEQVGEELRDLKKKLRDLSEDLAKINNAVERGVKKLLVYGENYSKHKASLGFTTAPLSDEVRKSYGLDAGQGVKIASVNPELEKLGIKKGNALVAIDGTPCKHDAAKQILPSPVDEKMLPGDHVTLTIIGSEGKRNITIRLLCAQCGDPASCPMAQSLLPSLGMTSVMDSNEAAAISALRTLSSAQELYRTRYGNYGTLEQLADRRMIDRSLSSGNRKGFTFKVEVTGKGWEWEATARPEKPGQTGKRSFHIGTDGVIRTEECTSARDKTADGKSPVLGSRIKKRRPRASREATNEASAISALRTLSSAEELYNTRYATYATLKDLAAKRYIDPTLASGKKNGYIFRIELPGPGKWHCTARPEKPGETGERSFYIGADGVIYYKECKKDSDTSCTPGSGKPLGQ